jgi:hypothetical protein
MTLSPQNSERTTVMRTLFVWLAVMMASHAIGYGAEPTPVATGRPADEVTSPTTHWRDRLTTLPVGVEDVQEGPDGILISTRLTTETLKQHMGKPGAATISWSTESEKDNLGFLIMRSRTKEPPSDFKRINKKIILGAGNSSVKNIYKYYDLDVIVGEIYFYYLDSVSYQNKREQFSLIISRQVRQLNLTPPAKKTIPTTQPTTGPTTKGSTQPTAGPTTQARTRSATKPTTQPSTQPTTLPSED